MRLLGLGHQRLDLLLVGEIAGQHVDALPSSAASASSASRRVPESRDRRALRVQRARDRAADAAGRAGDERGLAGQIEHAMRSSMPFMRCAAHALSARARP